MEKYYLYSGNVLGLFAEKDGVRYRWATVHWPGPSDNIYSWYSSGYADAKISRGAVELIDEKTAKFYMGVLR